MYWNIIVVTYSYIEIHSPLEDSTRLWECDGVGREDILLFCIFWICFPFSLSLSLVVIGGGGGGFFSLSFIFLCSSSSHALYRISPQIINISTSSSYRLIIFSFLLSFNVKEKNRLPGRILLPLSSVGYASVLETVGTGVELYDDEWGGIRDISSFEILLSTLRDSFILT